MTFPPEESLSPEEERREETPPLAAPVAAPIGPVSTSGDYYDDGSAEPVRRRGGWRRARRLAVELVETLFLAILIFFAVRALAQNFRVEGSSMEPGLHDGQYLLVNKAVYAEINLGDIPLLGLDDKPRHLFRAPRRGDVVVFRFPRDPDRDFIKRVIGLPGDTVQLIDGAVLVNGVKLKETYVNGGAHSDFGPQVVPDKQYFVLGDNRPNSSDSRSWGFVPEANIIGQAMFSYWPLEDLGGVGNTTIDLGIISIRLP